jgi:hypothetical protein
MDRRLIDPTEQRFPPRPAFPPSRETVLVALVLAFLIAGQAVFSRSLRTTVLLSAVAIVALVYRSWTRSRGAYIVGPDYFGLIDAAGRRRTWPKSDIGNVEPVRRRGAFGPERAYLIIDKDDRPLMAVRPALMPEGALDPFWERLGTHP